MRILVTGALGHIGSKLIRELPEMFPDVEILMVDNLMTQRYCSLFDLPEAARYRFVEGDVTQIDLDPLLDEIDVLVHLAAITDAAGSFDNAEQMEANNFIATRAVAEACARRHVRLIAPSSTSVYGKKGGTVFEHGPEEDIRPQSPYAKVKIKEEKLLSSLRDSQGLRAVSVRFGTIFGISPGMRFHTAVNKFCWQAVMGLPISVWRTAYEQQRPYLDLKDATAAIAHIIGKDLFDEQVFNVVTHNYSVRNVVDAIRKHCPSLEIGFVDNKIMNDYSYDVSRSRIEATGFEFMGDLSLGVDDTIAMLRKAQSLQVNA